MMYVHTLIRQNGHQGVLTDRDIIKFLYIFVIVFLRWWFVGSVSVENGCSGSDRRGYGAGWSLYLRLQRLGLQRQGGVRRRDFLGHRGRFFRSGGWVVTPCGCGKGTIKPFHKQKNTTLMAHEYRWYYEVRRLPKLAEHEKKPVKWNLKDFTNIIGLLCY